MEVIPTHPLIFWLRMENETVNCYFSGLKVDVLYI